MNGMVDVTTGQTIVLGKGNHIICIAQKRIAKNHVDTEHGYIYITKAPKPLRCIINDKMHFQYIKMSMNQSERYIRLMNLPQKY